MNNDWSWVFFIEPGDLRPANRSEIGGTVYRGLDRLNSRQVDANFHELVRRAERMIVRQEMLIAALIRGGHDPADAKELLNVMEQFRRLVHETILVSENSRAA